MAAMKNPHNLTSVFSYDQKECERERNCDGNRGNLYVITLNDRVFACRAHSRTNAIDIASESYEFGDMIDHESMGQGRPIHKYEIPSMNVIRVRPYHRSWWWGNHTDSLSNHNHLYITLSDGKPTIYSGNSTILDFASSKGMVHKVKVYENQYENAYASV